MPKTIRALRGQRTTITGLKSARLRVLADRIHALGSWPLFCLLRELDEGGDLLETINEYARRKPGGPAPWLCIGNAAGAVVAKLGSE
jgi:hypothetical protein